MNMESLLKLARNAGLPAFAAMIFAGLSVPDARAIGFLIPNQDAAAIARGNAFGATADNPSAIYYNPAGITQVSGTELEIGDLNYMGLNVHYTAPDGATAETKFKVIPVPQIYFTTSPTNLPLSFGLGIYAPFGLGVEWPGNSVLRTEALNSQLTYLTVNPVVAWKVLPSLSIALGPTVNYAKIQFDRGLATDSDYFKFVGDDISLGLTAGVLWQPHPKWSFGANYRLASTMDFKGNATYSQSPGSPTGYTRSDARLPFPQIISGGISFRPTPKWNIEADVDYIEWDSMNTVTLNGTANLFGSNLPLVLNWQDSWQYKFGVTRYLKNGWYVSAGYFFTSQTTSDPTYLAGVPDAPLHVGSLGFGRDGEHWHWAVAGQIIAGSHTVSQDAGNTDPYTKVSTAGNYQLFIPTLSFSVGYKF